jgi:hypothetical protein
MQSKFLIIVLLLACASAQATDVYKWTDATGVVQYTQSEAPANVQAVKMHLVGTASTAAAADVAAEDASGLPTAQNPEPRDSQVVAAADGVKVRCERARADLELLQGSAPVGLNTGGAGEAQPLDEAGRKVQIANAQSIIAHSCL